MIAHVNSKPAAEDFGQSCVTRNWYVVCWAHELGQQPMERLVCGQRIALFRDSSGSARAISAVCPHRGANLALGEVDGDSLRCPFHGIAFDGGGKCTRIPSQPPTDRIPDRLRTPAFPLREAGGLLWVWPEADAGPGFEPNLPEFLALPSPWHRVTPRSALCTGSYLNSLENALDDAHLAFVHRKGLPGAPSLVSPYRVSIAPDRRSYFCEADAVSNDAVEAASSTSRSGLGTGSVWYDLLGRFVFATLKQTHRRVDYDLSGLVCYTVDYAGGLRDHTFAFFTPADEQRTWMIGGIVRNHSLNPLADRFLHRFMPQLQSEDVGAMDLLVPEARGSGGLTTPFVVRADRTSYPFRRLYGAALKAEGKRAPWTAEAQEPDLR